MFWLIVIQDAVLHLVLRLRGGGGGPEGLMEMDKEEQLEMAIAAGGSIKQVILRDQYYDGTWKAKKMVMFNLQLFNASTFASLGIQVPPTPITASTYAAYGYPFFDLDEKPSGVSGSFSLNTVGQLDTAENKNGEIHEVEKDLTFPTVKIRGPGWAEESTSEDVKPDEDKMEEAKEPEITTPGAIKLNTVDQKSIFLPIRLLEKKCQKGSRKRRFSED
jgi:hypothetical protein